MTAVVIGAGAGTLAGAIPGVPLRSGPLKANSATEILAPIRQGNTGVFWGVLELNGPPSGSIVLDSVQIANNPDDVELLRDPYIWDEYRFSLMEDGGFSAYPLPLPLKAELPENREIDGFRLTPGSTPQVILEFATPEKASTVQGIKVRYHQGRLAYEKTFDMSFTLCPPSDPALCH
ncbi:hypothetical protein Kisp02_59100 [Kineosporia sp. NBRC 101731]|nr:hypothetical protein Kisp02_59100 [Kineosporia sp. NBRC 101731]